jgi:hypothetical protein
LFVGGAAGQSGALFLRDETDFRKLRTSALSDDAGSEDMAPLWIDIDSDGDLDLYVVSGGIAADEGSSELQDRLYFNDGQGQLSPAPEGSLPDMPVSGSVAAACDFDRDGDLDLFVGGRVIPGKYPLAANSYLLRNDDGSFVDATQDLAPGLDKTGMVTSALWSDVDGDSWPDLLVTHEWGPVKWYRNDAGQLKDQTSQTGIADVTGWWNGITGRDVDGDGDIDYAVTNFGLNTKYHASAEKPTRLYYGDFEGDGKMELVEAEFEEDVLFPVRGRSCSSNAMPSLREKFPRYHDFAVASLAEIYTPQCLGESHQFEATTLESGILVNDGSGRFTFKPLPRIAQIAPGFSAALTEVDGDGHADLYIVQNFYSPQRETGRMDGGVSLLLLGDGSGSFDPVWPDRSGLVVAGDAKGLTTADLNQDGWVDFVATTNDGELVAFQNRGSTENQVLNVRLQGRPGNPTGIGSRVTVRLDNGRAQTAEVYAGGGYLSQSSAVLTFGLGTAGQASEIEVAWPDGEVSSMMPGAGESMVVIVQPTE